MILIKKIVILLILLIPVVLQAQSIAGYSYIELTKPVTKEQKTQQRAFAKDSLSSEINSWFKLLFPKSFDTTNTLSMFFKDRFINLCIEKSKEYSVVKGHTWSVEYSVNNATIDSIMVALNKKNDSIAVYNKELVLNALKTDDISTIYNSGVKSLVYSMAHIGTPLASDIEGQTLTDRMRSVVQSVINRLTIEFDLPVVIGTPLMTPKKPITVQINTDTILMSDFMFSCFLADGEKIFTAKTNRMGTTNLNSMKIPFVNNSTFLYVRPDFAKTADLPITLSAKDLGLIHTEETDQSLIFKITKAKYTLHYKLVPTGIADLPSLFKNDIAIRKFINDSLPLTPAANSSSTDLLFDISYRVISKTNSRIASRVIKTEATITINNLKSGTAKVMKKVLLKEKEFDTAQKLQDGLYYWDCMKTLKTEIRKLLIELQKM